MQNNKRHEKEFGATAARKRHLVIDDRKFLDSVMPMKLCHVKKIERLFSSSDRLLHPHLKDLVIDRNTNARGTTPLIIACQHGELDSVKRLIEIWGVDLRAPANYHSDSSNYYYWAPVEIERMTPLFVAAFHGHNEIVRYLLEKGAIVSAKIPSGLNYRKQFDGWTPLYGAVYNVEFNLKKSLVEQQEERNAVVRSLLEFGADSIADSFNPSNGQPMWIERICGADAIIALINHGLDLTRRSPKTGQTILHHIAYIPYGFTEDDSLAIVKLLVEKGANVLDLDNERVSPLMIVADEIVHSMDDELGSLLNLAVLDFLLERDEYGPMEKVEAMEFAGATILFDVKFAQYIPKAFKYWRRAHQLRQMEIEVNGPSSEKILGRKIGRHVEWTTLEELDQIMKNPEEYKVQSLLVKLRIMSGRIPHSHGNIYYYKHHNLSTLYIDEVRGSAFLNSEELDSIEESIQCLDIKWGMLDLVIYRLGPSSTIKGLWVWVGEYVNELVMTFENYPSFINFERIKISLDLILQAMDSSPVTLTNGETGTNESFLQIKTYCFAPSLFALLEMIFRLPEIPNEHEMNLLTQSLRKLGPGKLGILLLPACKNICKFNHYLTFVRVLLEAGADPNVAVDKDTGNASLHVAAGFCNQDFCDATGTLLLENGAHLDRINKAGQTAMDVWIETRNRIRATTRWVSRPNWCRAVPKLLCLSARCVRVNKIPYTEGKSQMILHSLIELR